MITHRFAEELPELALPCRGEEQPDAALVLINEPLALELGLDPEWLRSADGIDFLLGHADGEHTPHAQGYAGYQFGSFNPRMGDGRALLLGEVATPDGSMVDLHAKGTGLTPWSRPGSDGRGTLRSMLREYLMAEALHALGVPTTRGLAVLSTGRSLTRHLSGPEPAGVHVRVAASHVRIGSFHLAAQLGIADKLADFTIARHYPGADYRGLYQRALAAQIATVAHWQRIGFIHGVMNTDNTTLSGQTIDFGPCAFMENFDADTWFSSIDTAGRYRFSQQPGMLGWNFARLAESMLPLFSPNPNDALVFAQAQLEDFFENFDTEYRRQLVAQGVQDVDTYLANLPGRDLTQANLDFGGPRVIPRARYVEAVLADAARGDLGPYLALLDAVTHPWDAAPEFEEPSDLTGYQTFCGT